jgi:co-chaperonin GroES (HSP10)
VYKKYAGTELTWEDREYLLVKSEDLQAKVM